MKSEDEIRKIYRSYIELWASNINKNSSVLYGAILAYGRVLEFSAKKIEKDMVMAKNKYSIFP
jgi:dimeric dUTPase (all-alpha-NTP-PPase superfamily)